MKVLVIGAGIAGLCSARFLVESGVRDITVVDRASGAGMGTSYANGALMHPSSVEPWNSPGILSYLLRNMGREDASVLVGSGPPDSKVFFLQVGPVQPD